MSTKSTIAGHEGTGDEPSWHLYEECFEEGVVYLQLDGVHIEELATREKGSGALLVVRLPVVTAEQLGLHSTVSPERWASAAKGFDPTPEGLENLGRFIAASKDQQGEQPATPQSSDGP